MKVMLRGNMRDNTHFEGFEQTYSKRVRIMRIMMILVAIIVIGIFISIPVLLVSGNNTLPKYGIVDVAGFTYYTDEITEKDNCVYFMDRAGTKQRVCGSYTLKEFSR
jgi:hypothetical protein